ncbi:MAG TPA: tetratricopeptide repeat protein [Bacteroidales bacterium]|nr:tetratricopeptide repeat protein [Bacteroidales bacterium]
MNKLKILLVSFIMIMPGMAANAQMSFSENDFDSEFNRGMDLFYKEKYVPAIKYFDSYIRNGDKAEKIRMAEAEYHAALSALRLFNPDAEYRMRTYLKAHPESPRINEAYMSLGDYFYQNKNYRRASEYYGSVDRMELKSSRLPEYSFRYGYSLYMKGDKQKAQLMFAEIKDIDTEYTPPAIYYYSQIAYEDKMYETALEGFSRLKDDETFGPIVPFYIIQILYLNKDYDEILRTGPDLLQSAPPERAVELYRFIGDANYKKENYREALKYLEQYAAKAKTTEREDKYQLGYCYYKTGNYDRAIQVLSSTSAKSDALSQNIWYVLGDCYLKTGDKKRAQFAFGQASQMNFDNNLKEDALFNFAKLTYETSSSPFGEAIAAFQEYIELYPASDKIEEAYNYLVATFSEIRNYKAAITALDRIRNKDGRLGEAYQRVAFFRGLELLKNMEVEESITMFNKSLSYGKYNRDLMARATYWRGEAEYRSGKYEGARDDFETFLGIPGAARLGENALARYNLAYSQFNLQNYPGALASFRSFESEAPNAKPEILTDTKIRIADCYFITTNYPMAISYYDKVIESGRTDADYAMYQKGFCLGLSNNQKGKIDILTSLISRYPNSSYVPSAIFERGRAYVALEDFKRGESDFINVIANYQSSAFAPRATIQLGLLYFNLGENEKSIAQFKKVIENYKSTPEARYALTGLKNAYVEINDVEGYFSYVKTIGYGDVSATEKDSLLYASGENLYMERKYDRAAEVFRNYLREFSYGSFRLNAQFYLAECLMSSRGNRDEALTLYRQVAEVPNNPFLEQALISAADLLYEREEYAEASGYYERLEKTAVTSDMRVAALKGQLRAAYQEGDARKSIEVARKIRNSAGMPEELNREAVFISAKALYSLNQYDEALADFRKVATEIVSIEGAESKYRVAEILFLRGNTDEAEKVVNQFIGQNSPHQYWMAKMFLLLADISIKKGDTLQARATLQSLREYYTISDDGILDEVRSKLAGMDEGN